MATDVIDLPEGFTLDVGGDLPEGFTLDTRAPIDRQSGAGFWQRLQAGFKSNPESVANFYRARLGPDQVRVERGEVQFLNPETGQWTLVDPEGLDWGDVADLVGELPEIIGGGVGGVTGAVVGAPTGPGALLTAAGGAAAGTAAGNVVKQTIGSLLPGEDVETPGERVVNVAQAGALGAVGEGVGQLVFKGIVNPVVRALFSRGARATNQAELKAIERAVGVPEFRLKAGNETENLFALQQKAVQMVDEIRGGAAPQSNLAVGTQLQDLFKTIDDAMVESLEVRGRSGFKVLKHEFADVPLIQTPNLRAVLDDMVFSDTTTMGVEGAAAKGAQALLKDLPQQSSLRDIQLYLRRYGRIGYGKGDQTFLEKMGDTDRVKAARRMFAAISDDLDLVAGEVTQGGFPTAAAKIAQDLRIAKDSYRAGLNELSEWQNGLFSRVVGDFGPESAGRVVQNLKRLDANEMKSVMTIISTQPDVANAVRANWIEDALQTSLDKAAARGSPGFSPKLFMDELGLTRRGGVERIQTLLGRSHADVLSDITTMQQAFAKMQQLADSPLMLRSIPLSKHGVVMEALTMAGRNVKRVSKWLQSPRSMEELRVLAAAKQPTQRTVAAITFLMADELADEIQGQ